MSQFAFKKSTDKYSIKSSFEEGVHVAAIVQVANIGLQLPFNKGDEPEAQMAIAFEIDSGDLIAK
jgi:hypothetical protein